MVLSIEEYERQPEFRKGLPEMKLAEDTDEMVKYLHPDWEEWRERKATLCALDDIDAENILRRVPRLLEMMADRDWKVRWQALECFKILHFKNMDYITPHVDMLLNVIYDVEQLDTDGQLRFCCCSILMNCAPDILAQHVPLLMKMMESNGPGERSDRPFFSKPSEWTRLLPCRWPSALPAHGPCADAAARHHPATRREAVARALRDEAHSGARAAVGDGPGGGEAADRAQGQGGAGRRDRRALLLRRGHHQLHLRHCHRHRQVEPQRAERPAGRERWGDARFFY